ncbi:MAG: PilZ domain-containing protein [Candidatus Omnitrophota bacterium]
MVFDEKRAFPRVSLNIEVDYAIISLPESGSLIHSKDISEGGIRIVALEKLAPQTMLKLKFLLPGSKEPVCVTGKVIWADEFSVGTLSSSKAYETGVEFVSINKEDRAKINKFVFCGF